MGLHVRSLPDEQSLLADIVEDGTSVHTQIYTHSHWVCVCVCDRVCVWACVRVSVRARAHHCRIQNFSKVSVLLKLLWNITIELTFEKFCWSLTSFTVPSAREADTGNVSRKSLILVYSKIINTLTFWENARRCRAMCWSREALEIFSKISPCVWYIE